jgi:quercetin dioxygenase-like cupin family protein
MTHNENRAVNKVSNPPPKDHLVLLENEKVRVLEFRIKPGNSSGLHSHPPNVVYSLSAARIEVKSPNQQNRKTELKQGDVIWSEGGSHEVVNVGSTDSYGIVIELKQHS